MADPWRIRPATTADGARLVPLERRCFSDPWSAEAFAELLRSPLSVARIAEAGGSTEVLGYLIARSVAGEGEILNLATAPDRRRQGLGRALLDAGLAALAQAGARQVYLEVRQGNAAAQALYQSAGFRPVGRRVSYYRNPVEDAVVLHRALAAARDSGTVAVD